MDHKKLIEDFAENQQKGHFACPRCGRMDMAQRFEQTGSGLCV